MKASVLYEHAKFDYREVKDIACREKEVKIRVYSCGICGSDIHKMQTKWKYGYPAIIGHEYCGEVVECGKDVTKFKIGDRVVCVPFMPCNKCEYCKQSIYSMCENYKMIGSQKFGGFAEYSIIPEDNLLNIGDLDYDKASFIEPLAVVMHAVMGIDIDLGDTVVILGAGTIGMLVLQAIISAGASKVIVVDIDNRKLKLAKKLGATYTINSLEENLEEKILEFTNDVGVDIALECAGSTITQEQALLLTKKHGKVGYLGIAYKDVTLKEKAFENIFRKELTLKGFWNSYSAPFPGREWSNAIDLISKNKIDVESLVTHKFSLRDVDKAFEMILGRNEPFGKVLILPQS
ncbi:galactitol-1-phosphate 5-dehydrogenase [Gemella cuniculi]|uniref:galactitol-1-phosphate 5-dehydrogenase n=1 Tax=Gemella cuniculi TaxID=150240 RepID=UPI000416581F|nr:galactitol-1-phosphate 5-dehydrogenase [Gemella cuniculi]